MKTRLLAVSLLALSLLFSPVVAQAAQPTPPASIPVSGGTVVGGGGTATTNNIWCAFLRICVS